MRFEAWLAGVERMVVIEIGVDRTVQTVVTEMTGSLVIRINTEDYMVDPKKGVGLQGRALGLLEILDGTFR